VKTSLQVPVSEYRKLSDEELVHRFAFRQDKNAANYLFERYGHLVFGICLRYFPDKDTAQDHTQQIFIKLLEDLPRFHIDYFKAWLAKVTRNHCLMQLRKPNREATVGSLPLADMENDSDLHHKIEQEHLFDHLEEALKTLNPEQQVCIDLFYLKKMTYSEIMTRTGYTFKEVKSYLQNGRRHLKLKMEALGT